MSLLPPPPPPPASPSLPSPVLPPKKNMPYEQTVVSVSSPGGARYDRGSTLRNITDILMMSAAIPNSRYVVHDGNSRLGINGQTVNLPRGNYRGKALLDHIQASVRNQTGDTSFSCSADALRRVRLSSSEGALSVAFPDGSTLHRLLGLPAGGAESGDGQVVAPGRGADFDAHLYRVELRGPAFPGGVLDLGTVLARRDDAISFHSATAAEARRSRPLFDPPLTALRGFSVHILDDAGRGLDLGGLRASVLIRISHL